MKLQKTHEWSPQKWSHVLVLCEGGRHMIDEITEITGVPRSTVSNIQLHRTPNSKPKMGWPKLLTAHDKCRIDTYIWKSKSTWQSDANSIIKELGLSCGHTTLNNALHKLEYYCC